jgi:hypothetical protein
MGCNLVMLGDTEDIEEIPEGNKNLFFTWRQILVDLDSTVRIIAGESGLCRGQKTFFYVETDFGRS